MKIGNTIKEIREKEKKIKIEVIAAELNITLKAYCNIENNISDITLTRLYKLAEIFECTPEYILNYQERVTYASNFKDKQKMRITSNGSLSDHLKNLQKQLHNSKERLKDLKEKYFILYK